MNYDEFVGEVMDRFLNKFPEATITKTKMNKTNKTVDSIRIEMPGENISPVAYPEKMYEEYENGRDIDDIVNAFIDAVNKTDTDAIGIPELTLENAKGSLYVAIMNIEKNRENLADVPYEKLCDLAIVPRWRIREDASFIVRNGVLEKLGITKDELLTIAKENTSKTEFPVMNMLDMLRDLMGPAFDEETMGATGNTGMYVITNKTRLDGAAVLANRETMDSVREQIGDDLYVLPSSRHEIICLKQSDFKDVEALAEMVQSVNQTSVEAEDYLSDSVYAYGKDGLQIVSMPVNIKAVG